MEKEKPKHRIPQEPASDLPRDFRIQPGDLLPHAFNAGDLVWINTDRVLQKRKLRKGVGK